MRIPTTVSAEPHFLDCGWYSTVESTSLTWNHVQTFAFLHNMRKQDDYSKFAKIISVLYIATKFYIKSDFDSWNSINDDSSEIVLQVIQNPSMFIAKYSIITQDNKHLIKK